MRPAGAALASRALALAGHALTRTGARRRQRRARAPRFCVTERADEPSSVGGAVRLPAPQLSFCLGASPWPHVPGRGVGPSGSRRVSRPPPRLADSLRGGAGVCACALGACARGGPRPTGGADQSGSQPGPCRVWRVALPSLGRSPSGGGDGGGGPAGSGSAERRPRGGGSPGPPPQKFPERRALGGAAGEPRSGFRPCRPSPRARGGRCCAGRGSGARPGGRRALGAAAREVPEPFLAGGVHGEGGSL